VIPLSLSLSWKCRLAYFVPETVDQFVVVLENLGLTGELFIGMNLFLSLEQFRITGPLWTCKFSFLVKLHIMTQKKKKKKKKEKKKRSQISLAFQHA
jgi:hypothetical protein